MNIKHGLVLAAALVVGSGAAAAYASSSSTGGADEGATAVEQESVSADTASAGFEKDACPQQRRFPIARLPRAGFRYGAGWRGLPARVRGWWRF
jgi:hypothetical protein